MFDATHLQNVQPTATVNVAEKSNHQEESDLKSINIPTGERRLGGLEILWNLDFRIWNFPTNGKFHAGLHCARELQYTAMPLTFGFRWEP